MDLEFREHAGKDFEAQVVFISQSVGAALDDTDLVVQAFDEPERDFVLGLTIRGDPIPVTVNHFSELLQGFESLPAQLTAPVIKELACPSGAVIVPELAEGLFQHLGGVEALIGRQEFLQSLARRKGQVLPMGYVLTARTPTECGGFFSVRDHCRVCQCRKA